MHPYESLLIAKSNLPCHMLPHMANRHGLISGATGTGKTVTLQVLAESFSKIGVPVFLSDIKGDLSGLAREGDFSAKIHERIHKLELINHEPEAFPVRFFDIFGENGHPIRTTITEMGPLLLSRLLQLNDIQSGILRIAFKIADDQGLLLLDLKDLKLMLQHLGDNASSYTTQYGNISKASVGAIQRGLLTLEDQKATHFFGEPAFQIHDFFKSNSDGKGYINILASDQLFSYPLLYGTFLLWLLSELYEELPEVGDLQKPKLVFFFDEAHLLFKDLPKALLDKVEQVVRLIRSKGVAIFFITQNPTDIPDVILSQLGNRVQHALRSFTARDQKSLKAAAETFRINPDLDIEKELTNLETGEALVSFLDEKGRPQVVQKALILPPRSQIGPIERHLRQRFIDTSDLHGKYEDLIDRESAYEILQKRAELSQDDTPSYQQPIRDTPSPRKNQTTRSSTQSNRKTDSPLDRMAKSMMTSVGRQIGTTIARGILGSLLNSQGKK
jgi:DNA helicase HerA-like ATPase